MSYTYALLDVKPATFEEIKSKLMAAGYDQAIDEGVIDMHGLALVAEKDAGDDEIIQISFKPTTTWKEFRLTAETWKVIQGMLEHMAGAGPSQFAIMARTALAISWYMPGGQYYGVVREPEIKT